MLDGKTQQLGELIQVVAVGWCWSFSHCPTSAVATRRWSATWIWRRPFSKRGYLDAVAQVFRAAGKGFLGLRLAECECALRGFFVVRNPTVVSPSEGERERDGRPPKAFGAGREGNFSPIVLGLSHAPRAHEGQIGSYILGVQVVL